MLSQLRTYADIYFSPRFLKGIITPLCPCGVVTRGNSNTKVSPSSAVTVFLRKCHLLKQQVPTHFVDADVNHKLYDVNANRMAALGVVACYCQVKKERHAPKHLAEENTF